MRRMVGIAAATALAVALVGAAPAVGQGGERPGVTKTEIRVGGYASPPNDTLNVAYPDGFDGAEAYFDKVNKAGGVFGRKIKLVAKLSDQGQASTGATTVRSLVEEKKVFAVLPIMTNSFTLGGKYLSDNNIPAFGINVEPAWCGTATEVQAIEQAVINEQRIEQCPRSSLFAEKGSFLCFECPQVGPSFAAKQLGLTKVGIIGYTHISSAKCTRGMRAGFEKYGLDIVHENSALEFGFSVSEVAADAQAMKDAGVELVGFCVELGGAFKMHQALKQAGVEDVYIFAPEGYNQATLDKYGDQLNNWIFRLGFAPWQGKNQPAGTKQFLKAMKARGIVPSEHSQAGWINAALLVEGIKKAGPDFTRQSVIDAINSIPDWTADGILPGIDWTATGDGHGMGRVGCDSFVEAKDGKFIPRWGKPGQPFVCFNLVPLTDDIENPIYRPEKDGEAAATTTTTP